MNDAQPVNPNYVLNCRSVLITWPQSGDLTKEALLEGLRNIPALPIQYIIIGKEQHATTGGVHLHAYIVCERKCHIRSATNVFTFNGNKPNFAVSRVQRHTSGITYVSKDVLGGCPWELEDFKTPPSLLEWVANNLVSM